MILISWGRISRFHFNISSSYRLTLAYCFPFSCLISRGSISTPWIWWTCGFNWSVRAPSPGPISRISSFLLGILIVIFFYTFSSKLKHLHLEIKNSYSSDNKYLAVITENGLWIKDEIDNVINIINADRINKNFLINVSITQFDKKFELIQNITSKKIDVSKNNWVIKNANISKNNFTQKNVKNIIFKSHFDIEKINNLFSNLSSLTFWQLKKLKKDYKSLGYSTLDINTHLEKIYAYPIYLSIMTLFAGIIMLNIKFNKPKIFNIILGILLSVVIYYINYFSNILGENGKISTTLSVWMPLLILSLISSIGLVRINEK